MGTNRILSWTSRLQECSALVESLVCKHFSTFFIPCSLHMSSSNCCFLTCRQVSQETVQLIWYFHLFKNFPQFIVIHTVKDFGIVNKAEIDVFLELSSFFHDPVDVGNLRWCCESAALNMPANLENSAVATGLEKISFHSNPKERQCQRMLKLCFLAIDYLVFGLIMQRDNRLLKLLDYYEPTKISRWHLLFVVIW